MHEYRKVGPTFWTGDTGKKLRSAGPEALIVGMYLMTCPHSNMLGLYYVAPLYIAHETGLGLEGASKGLARACEAGFCSYDEASEMVWVHEMAAYQVGEPLEAKDNRCKGIQRDYDALPENPFLTAFYERYVTSFHLSACRGKSAKKVKPLRSPSKAPSKPGTGTGAGTEEGTGTEEGAGGRAAPADLDESFLVAQGVDPQHAADWLKVRKTKRAALTTTAWEGMVRQAAIAGITPAAAVQVAAERNWQAFTAEYYASRSQRIPQTQQSQAEINAEAFRLISGKKAEAIDV
jgi:hypothetical protein